MRYSFSFETIQLKFNIGTLPNIFLTEQDSLRVYGNFTSQVLISHKIVYQLTLLSKSRLALKTNTELMICSEAFRWIEIKEYHKFSTWSGFLLMFIVYLIIIVSVNDFVW